jgi:hypothetical protein
MNVWLVTCMPISVPEAAAAATAAKAAAAAMIAAAAAAAAATIAVAADRPASRLRCGLMCEWLTHKSGSERTCVTEYDSSKNQSDWCLGGMDTSVDLIATDVTLVETLLECDSAAP